MEDFTIEVTPRGAKKIDDFRAYLRDGTWVYVTSLPGTDFEETIDTCKRLAEEGMQPVPHFTARSLANKEMLENYLARVTSEAGVKRVLAIGGADKKPVGDFPDSISMLATGLFDKYGIESIGIAGHPEGSPDIERPLLREHGYKKIDYAELTDVQMYLVTQFVFEATPIIDWVERIRREGNNLPVIVGIPGLASLKSLIGHAKACGIGASMTVLTKQAKNVHKLLSLQEPDKLVRDLAAYANEHPENRIQGVHMFPLGGLVPSAKWSYSVVGGQLKLTPEGFNITA